MRTKIAILWILFMLIPMTVCATTWKITTHPSNPPYVSSDHLWGEVSSEYDDPQKFTGVYMDNMPDGSQHWGTYDLLLWNDNGKITAKGGTCTWVGVMDTSGKTAEGGVICDGSTTVAWDAIIYNDCENTKNTTSLLLPKSKS